MSPFDFLVEMSLPKDAHAARENYAGDSLVECFMEFLEDRFNLNCDVYVSWECLPDVTVLRAPDGRAAIIRSERLDSLLVEFLRLRTELIGKPHDKVVEYAMASIWRWQAEFFIGLRKVHHSLIALSKRHSIKSPTSHIIPVRDEALASIDQVSRHALQCFSLAHEVGHIVWPVKEKPHLDAPVDGISPVEHLRRDFAEWDCPIDSGFKTVEEAYASIDARTLFAEINADFFALEHTYQFIAHVHSCELSVALRATLMAAQAQFFMDSLKNYSRTIANSERTWKGLEAAILTNDVLELQTSIRARAILRRAGISWAMVENQGTLPSAEIVNRYVPIVDSFFVDQREIDMRMRRASAICGVEVMNELVCIEGAANLLGHGWDLERRLVELRTNTELRLDMYYILIAYGCGGAVAPEKYLERLANY